MLSSEYIDETVANFFQEINVKTIFIENSVTDSLRNVFPIAEEMITESLRVITDKSNYPVLVISKSGRNLSGVVIACMRKLQNWSLISILEEYRRFAGSRLQQQHEQFIELFDTELVSIKDETAPSFLTHKM